MNKERVTVAVSSVTGNTRKVAERIVEVLKEEGFEVALRKTGSGLWADDIKDNLLLLFFWCRKSGLDPASLHLIRECKGKTILAFGTMGGLSDSAYGERVKKNVSDELAKENTCAGVFLCRGKIREESTEKRRRLPKEDPHYLDDEGYKRHLASRSHPDEEDLKKAVSFLKEALDV